MQMTCNEVPETQRLVVCAKNEKDKMIHCIKNDTYQVEWRVSNYHFHMYQIIMYQIIKFGSTFTRRRRHLHCQTLHCLRCHNHLSHTRWPPVPTKA